MAYKTTMPFNLLRDEMDRAHLENWDLTQLLKRSHSYVSDRTSGLHGKTWTIPEAIKIMKRLKLPESDFLRYFGTAPVKIEFVPYDEKDSGAPPRTPESQT